MKALLEDMQASYELGRKTGHGLCHTKMIAGSLCDRRRPAPTCQRALSAFNGILILTGCLALSTLQGTTSYFPGRSSRGAAVAIGIIFIVNGALFTESFRLGLARRAGVAHGVGGVVYRPARASAV